MTAPELSDFVLVGGTSLALRLGHRESVDIDLFADSELDAVDLPKILSQFGPTQIIKKSPKIQVFVVSDVKIDFVSYRYPLIEPVQVIDNLRLASFKDIAAMKLNAIAGRGSKKDFIDLYFLLRQFSLTEMMGFYNEKYFDGSEFMVLKSLSYFDDADREPSPELYEEVDWGEIKSHIIKASAALM
ncbi:MAG: nucleotidyl transferase AbiEii/AbiGii toxin family protein [Cryomorphaceae bacterium]